jgi:hypothetical protein
VPALAAAVAVVLLAVPAHAAGKTVHITKSDSAGNAVAGATFTLYVDAPPLGNGPPKGAEDTVVQGTCTTGANGQCDITDVPPGDYWVSETGPPPGYAAAPDSTLKVKKGKKKVFEVVVVDDKKPANVSVNDPTDDDLPDDGTHIFQFGPSVAASPNGKLVGIAFNDSTGFDTAGGVSGVGFAFSDDAGRTFEDLGKVPTGTPVNFLLGQPSAVFDPATGVFVVASSAAIFADDVFHYPILVSEFDPVTGAFADPVHSFPGIPPEPAVAHDPWLVVDPTRDDLYLTFTVSSGTGQAEGFFVRSTDGGRTWKRPVSVTGPGTNDFLTAVVARNGTIYTTWTAFGDPATNDIVFASSTDGGRTFSPPVAVASDVPKSGAPAVCGATTRNTYLGQLVTADAPRVAVDPLDPATLFTAYPQAGADGDESDIAVSVSRDGGRTWSERRTVVPSAGIQMFPDVQVTPDGRIGVGYYDASSAMQVGFTTSFFDVFSGDPFPGPPNLTLPVSDAPFPLWNTGDPYDTRYNPCFGMQGLRMTAPGSGFYMAWADGGDPGPAGNAGVDPNIDFARFDGAALVTTTSVTVSKSAAVLTVRGTVAPAPLPGARVTVTLLAGGELVGRSRPVLDAHGRYETAFSRHASGTCELIVRFAGSDGRVPSSVRDTFAC